MPNQQELIIFFCVIVCVACAMFCAYSCLKWLDRDKEEELPPNKNDVYGFSEVKVLVDDQIKEGSAVFQDENGKIVGAIKNMAVKEVLSGSPAGAYDPAKDSEKQLRGEVETSYYD